MLHSIRQLRLVATTLTTCIISQSWERTIKRSTNAKCQQASKTKPAPNWSVKSAPRWMVVVLQRLAPRPRTRSARTAAIS